jgi:hypothetical protein
VIKATEARRARKAARDAKPPEKPRWKKFEDGDITVRDLTTKELRRHACANNDGSWEGKRRRLPGRLIAAMDREVAVREQRLMDRLVKPGIRAIRELIDDEENPSVRLAASKFAIERKYGKAVETIHHGVETEFDRLAQSAFIIQRGADLAKELEAHQEPEDIVDVEVIEEEA